MDLPGQVVTMTALWRSWVLVVMASLGLALVVATVARCDRAVATHARVTPK